MRNLGKAVAIEHEQLAAAHAFDKPLADELCHMARDGFGAQAHGVGDVLEAKVDLGTHAAVVAQQQVLGKAASRVTNAQHHVLFFRAVQLGAYHADEAERHAGMVGEHGFEVGAMDAAELHAREAFDGIVVDVVFEEHAVRR